MAGGTVQPEDDAQQQPFAPSGGELEAEASSGGRGHPVPGSSSAFASPFDDAVLKLKGLPYSTTEQQVALSAPRAGGKGHCLAQRDSRVQWGTRAQ